MLQVPWRDESLLIGDCSSYRERCDELKKVYPRLEASVKRALDRKHLEEETEKKVSMMSILKWLRLLGIGLQVLLRTSVIDV